MIERDVLDQVLSHRTTLVFVNSRGLAEKLTARLNDLYAQDHGTDAAQTQSPEGAQRVFPALRSRGRLHDDAGSVSR